MKSLDTSPPKTREQRAKLRAAPSPGVATPGHEARPWWRSRTLAVGLLGSLLMWAALPPLDWWPLAWIAPLPWLWLTRLESLPGRRPYRDLWLAGFVFWLGAVHWLRLPHWATSFGWLALSFYLAFYVPVFVGLTRIATRQLGLSVVLAGPVVWTGLELARGHLLTGFSMGLLGHTQYHWLQLVQIADLGGAYAVSFVIVLVAACLTRLVPSARESRATWPLLPMSVAMAATLAYGHLALSGDHGRPGPKVALIQGSIDTELKADPTAVQRIHDEYLGLTQRAVTEHADLDLIVWPETMCRSLLITHDDDAQPPPDSTLKAEDLERYARESRDRLQQIAQHFDARMLLGVDTVHYGGQGLVRYNSAVLVDPQRGVGPRYDKMHPVMFGEYVPLARQFPWLYRLTPLAAGIGEGTLLPAFELGTTRLVANICFESAVPHLIRRQVATLRGQGQEPDVLVNLTNDGWFWGSSELDMHLVCGVFRAIELRKPFLAAANTGFSAYVDADGRIVRQGLRQKPELLVEQVRLDDRRSLYSTIGDWPAGLCLLFCIGLGGYGLMHRWRQRRGTAGTSSRVVV